MNKVINGTPIESNNQSPLNDQNQPPSNDQENMQLSTLDQEKQSPPSNLNIDTLHHSP